MSHADVCPLPVTANRGLEPVETMRMNTDLCRVRSSSDDDDEGSPTMPKNPLYFFAWGFKSRLTQLQPEFRGSGGVLDPDEVSDEPCKNFAQVMPGIYRSSFPQDADLPNLSTFQFRTIITLVEKSYTEAGKRFIKANDIEHIRIVLPGNKGDSIKMKPEQMLEVLETVLDPNCQPVLIHCNQGKHRTGCVVGCIRMAQKWPISNILDEYQKYAGPKARKLDELFVREFDEAALAEVARRAGFISPDDPQMPFGRSRSIYRRPIGLF
ncbi:MAG: hypothetical protein M4579_004792 [Chaenotheca gracillima]|nr:MAG: hypothetical protein M4579_004792 [Chaenotheca gracillima]